MNRVDRLFGILLMLQTQRRIRARDIADKFEITERTVYRDMQSLTELGVPVVSLPGEGYELMEGYHLPPIVLSSDEAEALFLAGRMFTGQASGKSAIHAELALRKIRAILPSETVEMLESLEREVQFYSDDDVVFDLDTSYLTDIRTAIQEQRVIHMRYQSIADAHGQTATEREVEPMTLTFSDGVWYLSAFCRLRNDMRSFRVSRIQNLRLLDETFIARTVFDAPNTPIEVRVRFDARVVPRVEENQHYAFYDVTFEGENGAVVIYHVDTLSEIRNWIFGWGTQAEVLAPKALRDDLCEEARRLWERLK